jgi:hypothetical protein
MAGNDFGVPALGTGSPHTPDNTERLLNFLLQENAAHRDALREDSKANREMLLGTIRLVSIPVAAAILFLGLFGLKSFSDLKDQLRASASEQIDAETKRMQQEIRDKLREQFETSALQQMVKSAARDATDAAAKPLIKQEVISQVQAHIQGERTQIHDVVVSETKRGVSEMQPQIDAEITKQANRAEGQIQAQITPYQELMKVGTLATLARNGDGQAFDNLMKISSSQDPQAQQLATTTRNAIYFQYFEVLGEANYLRYTLMPPKSRDELLPLLASSDAMERKGAIDGLTGLNDKSVVPDLIKIMRNDPYIFVRETAYHGLVQLTGRRTNPLEPGDSWEAWWEKNKSNWPPKQ